MPIILKGIAAYVFGFKLRFQLVDDLFAQCFRFTERRRHFDCLDVRGIAVTSAKMGRDHLPVAASTLLQRSLDQLGNVATAQCQPFTQPLKLQPLGDHLCRQLFQFVGTSKQWRKTEPKAWSIAPALPRRT